MTNSLDKAKLKALMKGFKKREIKEEEIIKPKPFTPAVTKGDTPKLSEKPINKKIKNKFRYNLSK
jgi:hypothetical protein